jgi:hypothetical protein
MIREIRRLSAAIEALVEAYITFIGWVGLPAGNRLRFGFVTLREAAKVVLRLWRKPCAFHKRYRG